MPELIDLRRRIKSVRNTQQITQAMKTVATAKFKQAQKRILEARPYWHEYPELMGRLASFRDLGAHPLMEIRREKRVKLLVISSDKGLAGAFNSHLMEKAHRFVKETAASGEISLTILGKKAANFFKKQPYPVEKVFAEEVQKLPPEKLTELADKLMQDFVTCRCDAVYVAYNEFKSILAPQLTVLRLLPLSFPDREETPAVSPECEPQASSLLEHLLPAYFRDQVRHYYFESIAAEHAARMMAMDNASHNAEDLIEDLTLVLNKLRQRSITRELLEIMSAVNALAKN